MLTLKELQTRLGMSEWPVRRMLDAVAPLLQGQLHRKPGQPLQVDSAALGLLERAKVLMERGTARGDLVQVLQGELQGMERANVNANSNASKSEQSDGELVAELRRVIDRLEHDNDWLKARLEERMTALPANSQGRLTRLQALRVVLLGR